MELNLVATGIELVGATVKNISIDNSIVDMEGTAKRSFGLNINEPFFEKLGDGFFAQMTIDFVVEIEQEEDQNFKMNLSLEGAFVSEKADMNTFRQLVEINGAAAIIGIARGKIESITANIFNNGKVVIPFVNVVDYYKTLEE